MSSLRVLTLVVPAFSMSSIFSTAGYAQSFYAGGSLGEARTSDSESRFEFEDDDQAFKIFGGYRLSSTFAIEGTYTDFGESERKDLESRSTFELQGLGLSAIGILPVNQQFELFGKAGVLSWELSNEQGGTDALTEELEDDDTDLSYGIGASYDLNEDFSIRGEWEFYNLGESQEVDLFSFGARYRF